MPMRSGSAGSGALAAGREQAFGFQLFLELLEGQLQRAVSLRFDGLHHQLQVAAGVVKIHPGSGQHGDAILRLEFQIARRGLEADAAHLRVFVLQREIVVAAGVELDAGNLARDPNIPEIFGEDAAQGGRKLAHRKVVRLGRPIEGNLLHASVYESP